MICKEFKINIVWTNLSNKRQIWIKFYHQIIDYKYKFLSSVEGNYNLEIRSFICIFQCTFLWSFFDILSIIYFFRLQIGINRKIYLEIKQLLNNFFKQTTCVNSLFLYISWYKQTDLQSDKPNIRHESLTISSICTFCKSNFSKVPRSGTCDC